MSEDFDSRVHSIWTGSHIGDPCHCIAHLSYRHINWNCMRLIPRKESAHKRAKTAECLSDGARADLGQLRGNLSLAAAVIKTAEGAQQLAVEVQGQQGVEDLGGLLLEDKAGVEVASGHRGSRPLHRELAVSGGELEDLIVGGVHAVAVSVAELTLGAERDE
eukprot:scaffold203132_cov40-Prasinocladus_malaysianus.AAC.1